MRARHWGQRKPLWSLQNEGWWKHTGPHSESSCKGRNLFVLRLVTPFTQLVSTSSWARNSFPASCQHRGYGKKGPLGFWVVSDRGSSWFTRDDWDKTEPGPRMGAWKSQAGRVSQHLQCAARPPLGRCLGRAGPDLWLRPPLGPEGT